MDSMLNTEVMLIMMIRGMLGNSKLKKIGEEKKKLKYSNFLYDFSSLELPL